MKKPILFILILIVFSCSVNDNTGLIRVTNRTSIPLTNLKIGETLIVNYVAPHSYYDYWYFSEIRGKLTTESIPVKESQKGITFILKSDWWVDITAAVNNVSEDEEVFMNPPEKHGTNDLTYSDYIEE